MNAIAKSVFRRLVRHLTRRHIPDARMQVSALAALHAATEAELVRIFGDARLVAAGQRERTVDLAHWRTAVRVGDRYREQPLRRRRPSRTRSGLRFK